MSRLQPLNDFVFKKLMGEQGSEVELKSFLSAVLGKELKNITILENKNLTPEIIGDKMSVLDVRATTDDNTHANIEVQLKSYRHMDIRSLFYWSKIFSSALGEGSDYKELPNVVTVNLLDFDFIDLNRYHTTFHLWEDFERYLLSNALEMHFIEMPKFKRLTEKDVNNPLHRWLTFFDKQSDENTLKELVEMDSAIKRANEKLNFLSSDKDFLHQVHLREIALSDYTTAINDAKDEGKDEAKIEIAKKFLEIGLDIEQISQGTGLNIDIIKELQEKI